MATLRNATLTYRHTTESAWLQKVLPSIEYYTMIVFGIIEVSLLLRLVFSLFNLSGEVAQMVYGVSYIIPNVVMSGTTMVSGSYLFMASTLVSAVLVAFFGYALIALLRTLQTNTSEETS